MWFVWEQLSDGTFRTMRIEATSKRQAVKAFLACRPYTKYRPIIKARQA
jgi:hypothetical protein